MKSLKIKWLGYAVIGLLLLGGGLSMAIDAAFYRLANNDEYNWIYYGTAALIVFNSGICFFGQAVVYKAILAKEEI